MLKKLTYFFTFIIISFISYSYYNKYQTENEWSMLYTDSEIPSCTVSSKNNDGSQLSFEFVIFDYGGWNDVIIWDHTNQITENKYELSTYNKIHFDYDVIHTNNYQLTVNGEKISEQAIWPEKRDLTNYNILNYLLQGKNVNIELMKTNGEKVIITYKGNNSFLDKAKKCKDVLDEKIKNLNETVFYLKDSKIDDNKEWIELDFHYRYVILIDGNFYKIPSEAKYVNTKYLFSKNINKLTFKEMTTKIGYDYEAMKKDGLSEKQILMVLEDNIFSEKVIPQQ